MKIFCLYDSLVPVKELREHPKNSNNHPNEQIERLAKILDYQGWRYPIKVSKQTGFITSGHGRLHAAQKNGWDMVPVNFQDYESEDQERADLIADNSIASWAELDLAMINADIGDFGPDFDIDLLGIKDFKIEPADRLGMVDEDEVPESAPSRTVPGDLYRLGDHRLLCGDSTNIQHVERLMGGEKADMVFTDPPYGMKLDTDYSKMPRGSKTYSKVIGDDEPFDPGTIFLIEANRYCVWGADWFYHKMPEGFSPIVWDKQPHHTVAGPQNHFELCWVKPSEKRRIIRKLWTGFTAKEKSEDRVHPTQKPIEVCVDLMERGGNNVVDLFGGSGSTIIACEKTNRKCFMMELDPHYCDVIISRWAKFSGKEAFRVNPDGTETPWSEIVSSVENQTQTATT